MSDVWDGAEESGGVYESSCRRLKKTSKNIQQINKLNLFVLFCSWRKYITFLKYYIIWYYNILYTGPILWISLFINLTEQFSGAARSPTQRAPAKEMQGCPGEPGSTSAGPQHTLTSSFRCRSGHLNVFKHKLAGRWFRNVISTVTESCKILCQIILKVTIKLCAVFRFPINLETNGPVSHWYLKQQPPALF